MIDAPEWQAKKIKLAQKIAKEHPDLPVDCYWCHIPEDKEFKTAFGNGRPAAWGIYTTGQNGYKLADKRLPAYYASDIQEALDKAGSEEEQFKLYKILRLLEKK